jgi:TetR/AcrR family transcriptional regulator, repressor of the ameABC operon
MPKRALTLERITCKADEMFARFGPAKVSMCELADALGMSSANIYKFFSSKQALVECVADRSLTRLMAGVEACAQAEGTALERISAITRWVMQFHRRKLESQEQMARLIIESERSCTEALQRYRQRMRAIVRELLQEGAAQAEIVPLDDDECNAVVNCLLIAFDPLYTARLDETDQQRRAEGVMKLLGRLLKPPPA